MSAEISFTSKHIEKTTVSFMGSIDDQQIQSERIHLIGFPFDGTACFRKGTVNGPDAIRDVSDSIETYSPYLDKDLEDISFVDLGNLSCDNNWEKGNSSFDTNFKNVDLKKDQVKILTIGGEHSISYAPALKYLENYPDLMLIHLDAHADLRDGYEEYHYSHASIIFRLLERFGKDHMLTQFGIRSGTKEEYRLMNENKTLMDDGAEFLDMLREVSNERPIYLTLDLDFFDPSFMPGTGTPEPGGENFNTFIEIMKILANKNFVGGDCVELSPDIDPTGNSSVFAAKVIREMILAMARS